MRIFAHWISRLSVTSKLVSIYLLDLLVTASIVVSFVSDKADQIDFSKKELEGTAIYAPARNLYQTLIDDARSAPGAVSAASLQHGFDATDQARRQHGGGMSLDSEFGQVATAAAAYDKARIGGAKEAAFAEYQDKLAVFLAKVGDRSNLILDPDLDSYYAMAIAVVHMPTVIRTIKDLSDVALHAPDSDGKTVQISSLAAELAHEQADIRRSLQTGIEGNVDGKYQVNLGPPGKAFDAALDALTNTIKTHGDVNAAAIAAFDSSFKFWSAVTTELDRLLKARVDGLLSQTVRKLGLTLVLALGVLAAVTYIAGQITRPVRELVSVADSIRSGDPSRATWQSADEFGTLVQAFNGMLDRLAEEGKRREEFAAAARAAEAQRDLLEAIALPVIVTSLDGSQLLNANKAARDLFGDRIDGIIARAGDSRIMDRLASAGTLDEVEIETLDHTGKATAMVLSARQVTYHGERVALFGLTPINELKRTQAELRDAKEAAEVTANRLQQTTDSLMASIRYASRIQHSIFPDEAAVRELNSGIDIWVEQRDIVGGDWHWVGRFDDGDLVFLCDCTGHGVPGALMTMLVSACFRRVIDEEGHTSPATILNGVHRLVRSALSSGSGSVSADDGLDAVCVFLEHDAHVARIASARLSMFHHNKDGLHEIKGSRTSIGYPSLPAEVNITDEVVPVATGDLLYLFTDGFTDQIGGHQRLLFGRKRLFAEVDKISNLPAAAQIERLRSLLADYRNSEPMRDDASFLVVRVAQPATMQSDRAPRADYLKMVS